MGKLKVFVESEVKGTPEKAIVGDATITICHLTHQVMKGCSLANPKVHISARVLKHLYDKKPAEEFDTLVKHAWKIARFPNQVYANKNSKRGDLLFVRWIKCNLYACSIEIGDSELAVVTLFRVRKERYLNNYRLIWSWKDGDPSSSGV